MAGVREMEVRMTVVALLMIASAQTASAAPSAAPPQEDPVVCRSTKLADVGTRMKPKPVCMRKSEWAMGDKINKDAVREATQGGIRPGPSEGR